MKPMPLRSRRAAAPLPPSIRCRRAGRNAWSVLVGAALVLTGCGTSSATGESPVRIQTPAATTPVKGDPLDPPITMPAATLTDTAGKPYDVRARTKGRVTLLFIGFTHCEDVCPTTMADIAQALRKLPAAERNEISVVFVTADPWRDTPGVIRRWLDNFDRSFTGLTGGYPALRRFAKGCHVFIEPPSRRGGDYQVQHGAQTLIFDRDHEARELFTANPTPADLAHDLRYTLKS